VPGLLLALVPALVGLVGLAGWPATLTPLRPRHDVVLAGGFTAALCVLVHAQADWHWQSATTALPVVSLLAGGAALVGHGRPWSRRAQRITGGVLVASALLWLLPGLLAARLEQRAGPDADPGAARLAARLDPFDAGPLLTASLLEDAAGDRQRARRDARDAAAREPHDWATWMAVARVAATPAERAAACRQARRWNPRIAECGGS
jgi:hypothetical protein